MERTTRREFLATSLGATCGILGLGAALEACTQSAASGGIPGASCSAGAKTQVAAVSALTTTPAAFQVNTSGGQATVFAFKDGSGNPVVLSSVCPHQGCAVNWLANQSIFLCPCHGSEFDASGNVIQGPAQSNLANLQAQVQSGQVTIATC